LPSRFIWISPQLGQGNFVASDPGAIGFPQLVHVTNDKEADLSAMMLNSVTRFLNARLLNILCAFFSKFIKLDSSH
jgi:hypothetical protein